jgi:hypothetical protein
VRGPSTDRPRTRRRRDERGQALAIVVGLIGLLMVLPLSVQLLATGQLPIGSKASDTQAAEQAAHAGLADYVNHLQGPYSYLTHCSTGFTSLTGQVVPGTVTLLNVSALPAPAAVGDRFQIGSGSTGTLSVTVKTAAAAGSTTVAVNNATAGATYAVGTPVFDMTLSPSFTTTWTCPAGTGPDPNNPAFAGYPNDGHWAIVHDARPAGYGAFQYVVDAANTVDAGLGGIAAQHLIVYVTGRGGVPGRYVYSTIEVTLSLSPLVFSSANCQNTGYQITVPATATSAVIELWGAQGGASGGTGGTTGGGGDGDQITVYPPVTPGQTWVADPGAAGAQGDYQLLQLGPYAGGGAGCSGSLNSSGGSGGHVTVLGLLSGNGGGGGGASAVCFGTLTTCDGSQDTTGICTDAYVSGMAPANEPTSSGCVLAMAGGGGGDGGNHGGKGGYWKNGATYQGSGGSGSNILGLGSAAGGAAGANPSAGTHCGTAPDNANAGNTGANNSVSVLNGGGGGGGGGWCGGYGGAAGGILGLLLGTGGGGGVGGSAAMADPAACPNVSSQPITGYPVSFGSTSLGTGGNGAIMIAFFAGANCPGNVLQYSATVQLVQPEPPNTA